MGDKHYKYQRFAKLDTEIVSAFVPTLKTDVVKFRTTKELKKWLKETYNNKMSAYIESLIYADHHKRGINIYESKQELPRLTDDDLDIKRVQFSMRGKV